MTLLEIRNQLVGHFCQKDTFIADDFDKIKVSKDLGSNREMLVTAALGDLIEIGMIKHVDSGLWILCGPINAAGSDVHLSMHTCNEIADAINTNLASKGIDNKVDVLNIQEIHVVALIEIINELISTP